MTISSFIARLRKQFLSFAEEWFPGIQDRGGSAAVKGSVGDRGEIMAARHLSKKGLEVIERGYRNHIGEIDLIAIDKRSRPRSVVFIEVKTRSSANFGSPFDAVDARKQKQVSDTAMVYLKQHDLLECRFRFDIVAVILANGKTKPRFEYQKNAFPPVGRGQLYN